MLTTGAVSISATVAFASGWAHDQPRTIAFALADEPFGERSFLHPDGARRVVDGLLDALRDREGVTSLFLEPSAASMRVIGGDRLRRSLRTTVGGGLETFEFRTPSHLAVRHPDPVPVAAVRRLDLAAAVAATRRAWERTPGRRVPTLLLELRDGRIAGWKVEVFGDETTEVLLDPSGDEVDRLGAGTPGTAGRPGAAIASGTAVGASGDDHASGTAVGVGHGSAG